MVDRDALDFLKTHIGSDAHVQRKLGWPKTNGGQVVAHWRKRGISLRERAGVLALLKGHKAPADMVAAFERITERAKERALAALFGTRSAKTKSKGNDHGGKGNAARQGKRQRDESRKATAAGSRAGT